MNYQILVNKKNKITKQIMNNANLITIKDYLNQEILIEKKTSQMYLKLREVLLSEKIEMAITSAYRSIQEQEKLLEEFQNQYGNDYIKHYVALPGYSEHHTGLCLDLTFKNNGQYLETNEELLANEEIFLKIQKYLAEYGFIIRYPKEKETITGYSYEPWHIRYVGRKTAMMMEKEALCLEEYHQKYRISGAIIINKPSGMTSREIDTYLSNKFDTKKVGHTGTLDPLASGVLIVLINKATKISSDITSNDKEYIATVKIGLQTDTLDITGNVIDNITSYPKIDLQKLLKSFQKTYLQEVPIYSAVKVNGKKLYQYARKNIPVELPKKEVTIKEIELLSEKEDSFTFRCLVSKGTYIRSLIRDMGKMINIPMTMQNLIRTREADFSLAESFTLEQIEEGDYQVIPIEKILKYPIIFIEDELLLKKIINGMTIENSYKIENKVLFKHNNLLLAIYQVTEDQKQLKSYRNFN